MKHRLLLSFASLILSAGLSQAAFAGTFTLTLSNPNQSATPGATITYSGTIANTSGSSINLDGIEFNYNNSYSATCDGSAPCLDGLPFYVLTPMSLDATGANSTYTGILFNVVVPLTSALTTFSGFVDITGDTAGTPLVSNTVAFSTTVTPEPSSWLLMATGMVGLVIAYRFRPQTAFSMTGI